MSKVLILAGDAAEDLETMFIKYRLAEADYAPHVAAPTMRPIKLVVHDFEPDWDTYVERQGRTCPVDVTFAEVDPAAYVALVIPGGRAPEYLRMNKQVIGIVQHFSRENKPIAAVCHGAQLLAATGLIKGRKVSAYPACQVEVELAGAEYMGIAVDQAVTDGNLVTAPAWPAHPAWIAQFLAVLGTRISV